ncbi:alpha/beta hydrolase [Bosea sp. CS1GBMeth4]|uniref:alpha/beta fold hydrolase n=1 Tax=Bosea sp. CS1GBMeth4 TaxID=1892849 RepID=UPI001647CCD7|nr:alpha/beta hydrolase [Bosea sp. CS1GBMeth4]
MLPLGATAKAVHARLEGTGKPLVLVHELGGSLDSFELIVPHLADSHQVLRYDQNGCGMSAPAKVSLGLAGEADLLLELIADTFEGEPCRIVGVAAGAAIAITAALARPDAIAALALCAPALEVAVHRRTYLKERAARARAEGMTAIAEASLLRSYPPALRRDEAAFARYLSRFLATDPASYAAANLALGEAHLVERLPDVTQPCLFLAGRHDELRPPAEIERLSRSVPGARFAAVDSGHIMPMQAPAEMAEHLLAFFGSLPRPGREQAHA